MKYNNFFIWTYLFDVRILIKKIQSQIQNYDNLYVGTKKRLDSLVFC